MNKDKVNETYRTNAMIRMLTVMLTLVFAGAMLPGQSFTADAVEAEPVRLQ